MTMKKYNKDEEFNKIGRCWLCWLTDNKMFYDQVIREYDEDLYLMYDHLKNLKTRLHRISEQMIYTDFKENFVAFSKALVNEVTNMITSKEINEKYEDRG